MFIVRLYHNRWKADGGEYWSEKWGTKRERKYVLVSYLGAADAIFISLYRKQGISRLFWFNVYIPFPRPECVSFLGTPEAQAWQNYCRRIWIFFVWFREKKVENWPPLTHVVRGATDNSFIFQFIRSDFCDEIEN